MAIKEAEHADGSIAHLLADKSELRRIVDEEYRQAGIPLNTNLSIEEVQAMVAADLGRAGLRPEDNIFSRGLIAAREGEDV